MRKADIATLYKGKGDKSNLENERGIFIVSIFRSLIMRMIYQDIYSILDESMSDSQIGSRKGKNIRNHIWVLNCIIDDTLKSNKKHPVDIQIYDYKQCFDALWLEECLNDIYSGGLRDNKLNILHNVNSSVEIVVKTPVGKSNQETIQNVVIQGDVFAPMLCSKQIDMFGKECLEEKKYLYHYKGEVEIPPLTMVDDIICVAECGFQSVMVNSFLNCKTRTKKLQFGSAKCKKMHIGKKHEDFKCHTMFVDNWKEVDSNFENGKEVIEDVYVGNINMEDSDEEKYLGDIISKDGRNLKNIKARVNKGKGIVKRIMDILEGIPFGKLYFQIAIILRNSLLVSCVLCNSEAWVNITKAELSLIESVDLMLLRNILGAPKTVAKEILYLELGVLPLREIIRQRRLNFVHYILAQGPETIMFKVLKTQMKYKTKRDWVTSIENDLKELDLHVSFANIQEMKKAAWKNIVRNSIRQKTFKSLETMKQSHSKVKQLRYISLQMQDYLIPNDTKNLNKDDVQNIFKIRSKVMEVKMNRKNLFETHECKVCLIENETQEHLYECKKIWMLKNKIHTEYPNYEKILWGNVKEKVEVSKIFLENMKIRQKYEENPT